jgi:hypothetical protein
MDNRIIEVRNLKKQGLTIREISQRTGIPKSTVHNLLGSSGANVQMDEDAEVDTKNFRLIHLPYDFRCPSCGQKQNHVFLCLECGKCIPTECLEPREKECLVGFNLSQLQPMQ